MEQRLEFPYGFQDLTEDEKQESDVFGYDIAKIAKTKYCFSKRIKKYAAEFYNFLPKPDDVWLIGYPRSGTTMTQEIVYLLGTDLNYEQAASTIMDVRFPFLESALLRNEEDERKYEESCEKAQLSYTSLDELIIPAHIKLANSNEKRFIKSHLGFKLLHPSILEVGCKVIFIARNVKDCIVSDYFFPFHVFDRQKRSIYDHFLLYKKELLCFGSYFELLQGAWERKLNKNMLFLFYEEVNADKRGAIRQLADFLGKKITSEQLDKLVEHVSIKSFKKNKSLNNDHLIDLGVSIKHDDISFIRKGQCGDWRNHFSKQMNIEVNQWIMDNLKEIPDFVMPECWKEAMDMK